MDWKFWFCRKNNVIQLSFAKNYTRIEQMISFKWRPFEKEIILMLVRRYSAYSLSYRNIEELAVKGSWRMDENYLKIKGRDVYLYRAVDKFGDTSDFMLSKKRDKQAAFRFFCKAIGNLGYLKKSR